MVAFRRPNQTLIRLWTRLQEYSPAMQRLLERGYRAKERPSGHRITPMFKDNGASIPPNVLICGSSAQRPANRSAMSCSPSGRS